MWIDGQQLNRQLPDTDIVLTLGEQGLLARGPSGACELPAIQVSAVDETAAGDAFIGFLMAELIGGSVLTQALRVASAAGALAVTREGAAPSIPRMEELRRLLASRE